MNKKDLKSMTKEELFEELSGMEKYRIEQIRSWLLKGVKSFSEMSNIKKETREYLSQNYTLSSCEIAKKQVSQIDGTRKYLFKFTDGAYSECVLMRYKHGLSLCISTQIGCKMGCSFCATGKSGFSRDLLAGEMLSEVLEAEKDAGERISNIVLMGMGEPLDNYENVLKFLKSVSNEDGLNIGMRHISLSTCGLCDKIYKLSKEKLQLTLSVSLHAPSDEIRNKIMPVNRIFNVDTLINTCKDYIKETGRRISFEYSLINGVNDTDECALLLSKKLKGMLCHVNLIPVNEIEESNYKKSIRVKKFQDILIKNGINATVRRTLGSDISASCGQLKRRFEKEAEK